MTTKRICEVCKKPLPDKPYRPTQRVHKGCRHEWRAKLARERWIAYEGEKSSKKRRGPEFRKKQSDWMRAKYAKLKAEILEHYGNACDCCGEDTVEFLCIDHVNGGGRAHREETGHGISFYYWIVRNDFPDTLRLLCHNCNMALGVFGYCPHDRH